MTLFKSLLTGAAVSVVAASSALSAGVELNASSTGLALQGYDPVAYFTVGEATPGDWRITSTYEEATYRFSTEEHKAAFEADPEAFLPEYGGYCAFGAAMGFKFDGAPHQWHIADGQLYLNISADIQERWLGDLDNFITQADANWPDIAGVEPAALQQ